MSEMSGLLDFDSSDFIDVSALKKSELWKYFLLDKQRAIAKCNICHRDMKISGHEGIIY